MKLISVNISAIQKLSFRGKSVRTGIFKQPITGRVKVGRLSVEGDRQADLENHGGVDQAVYAYPVEHYAYWRDVLTRSDLSFGQFGENFTLEGMMEDAVYVGDVFQIGSAVVQITQARTPCYKLGAKMGSAGFPKQFLASRRLGFYLRVVQAGEVAAGDAVIRLHQDDNGLSVAELIEVMYFDQQNPELLARALRVEGLSNGWRAKLAERVGTDALP